MTQRTRIFSLPSLKVMPNLWDGAAFLMVMLMLLMLAYASEKMRMPFHLGQQIPISLDPHNLPYYAAETTLRMFIALFFSFVFSLILGGVAAKSERAGKILIPIIDILQSVPIFGYLSITVAGFIALFPGSMLGPECATIFVVITSQIWNMTLSFYQSLRTIPHELMEATQVYRLSSWQRFWRLEMPFAIPGLLWNAMMSMSGGWFFVVAAEAISVANQTITLPGIGSYIALAISSENWHAIFYAIMTMLIVIFLYDQLMFRPLIAWSQKFRLGEDTEERAESWVLNLFQRTTLTRKCFDGLDIAWNHWIQLRIPRFKWRKPVKIIKNNVHSRLNNILWYGSLITLGFLFGFWLWKMIYSTLPFHDTWHVVVLGGITGLRVFISIMICSLIWLPIGIQIGLNPKWAKIAQPIAQFLAAFPANLFFPVFVVMILRFHLNMEIWCAPLMVLGTQWYILFNVIAGATVIPKELKLVILNMNVKGWLKWKRFLIPAVFPYYLTGAITAAGNAWNTSVVAEIINWGSITLKAQGLGAYIQENTIIGNFPEITLGVVVMCAWVTLINLVFWRRLYRFAENRYRME
ncbi:MAG: ABC transporter permease subunit [Gammaproteobacteria bacterium]|nr:ABC transporter permease subunit [Gammaproteobacteria bacterium]